MAASYRGTPAQWLAAAVSAALHAVRGSWALAVIARGVDAVVLARHRSPLLVGEAPGITMAASDQLGFHPRVRTARELADGDVVILGRTATWVDPRGRATGRPRSWTVTARPELAGTSGAADFTAKEIHEQPTVAGHLIGTVAGRLGGGRLLRDLGLHRFARARLVACGTSANAAHVVARVLAVTAGVPATVVTASEHGASVAEPGTLTIALSQSGETADVLTALDAWTDPVLAITNHPQSTLARRADAVFGLGCGPEIGVAATKSFTAQVLAGSALALSLGSATGVLSGAALDRLEGQLTEVPPRLAATQARVGAPVARLADELAPQPGWIYVSRGAGVPYAMEGALKLKELAYRWVEALPAGELKHGPIALIQPGTPVVVVLAEPIDRLGVNIREMAARGARIVTVGAGEDADLPAIGPEREPPWGPIEAVVGLQHLAREVTTRLGHDVDRPRNLAKSVTVE